MGQVLSREIKNSWGADAVEKCGRQHLSDRQGEIRWDPARSETLSTFTNSPRENREIPCSPTVERPAGRIGKSKDKRR
jgi:hypothetical protein